jgi:hypothetical protein
VSPAPPHAQLALLPSFPGRCATCRHAQILTSKTSAFLRCGRSDDDPRFPRYPGLPVLRCAGWEGDC